MKDNMKILVGVDGSDHSKYALEEAITIAKEFSGLIRVITVYGRRKDQEAMKILGEAEQLLKKEKVKYELVSILGSNPSRALLDTARNEEFDLVVVGSRGLGSVVSLLLGSISKQVITKADCNVLVVKK